MQRRCCRYEPPSVDVSAEAERKYWLDIIEKSLPNLVNKVSEPPLWPHLRGLRRERHRCAHAHARSHTRVCAHTRTLRAHTHTHTHVHTHTHTAHTHTHARTHTHTHTHLPLGTAQAAESKNGCKKTRGFSAQLRSEAFGQALRWEQT